MLVSPAEPLPLRRLGRVSSTPENYGADFIINSPLFGIVGIQRKELSDLVQSTNDDRVAREVIQMKELDHAIWVLEGHAQWSGSGEAMWTRTRYTRSQHYGFLFSLLFQGFGVLHTDTINDTITLLNGLRGWLGKDKHSNLNHRMSPRGVFGKADTREWQIHFAQGLPGMGYERSKALVDHFHGLPFRLAGDLTEVPGIGKGTAKRVGEVLGKGEGSNGSVS